MSKMEDHPKRKGTKHDGNKPNISLIPREAIWGTAAALTFGANKYGKHNFRAGLEYTALAAAAMRHLTAWLDNEQNDPESGLSHLDHCMASLAMLKFMEQRRPEMDDRYKSEKNSFIDENEVYKSALASDAELTPEEKFQAAENIQSRGR